MSDVHWSLRTWQNHLKEAGEDEKAAICLKRPTDLQVGGSNISTKRRRMNEDPRGATSTPRDATPLRDAPPPRDATPLRDAPPPRDATPLRDAPPPGDDNPPPPGDDNPPPPGNDNPPPPRDDNPPPPGDDNPPPPRDDNPPPPGDDNPPPPDNPNHPPQQFEEWRDPFSDLDFEELARNARLPDLQRDMKFILALREASLDDGIGLTGDALERL
ncbi:hypothetical protein DEU56DRAFT_758885 [Suillus clintonianus]|uniref:uncharacterized protein n=1 Tax=Suillus clintonianus TaxID=1904413 RepID=UPI001B8639E1|nr:uncharacterized protein DEU56DRAFT_762419 [Suillus clintonianus]XP_041205008.1 uncharacterized protein DEU56DRAFT_758885 [Suillus clintonianus]KAG2109540.1 hypothetical protein DEU56DRAFT_762419 [Suillus clintonianus]KAG2126520.1 hypothetical protein DEU56DRAFT_758885 [Suillus clintonianus]